MTGSAPHSTIPGYRCPACAIHVPHGSVHICGAQAAPTIAGSAPVRGIVLYTVTMLQSEKAWDRFPVAVCTSQERACGIVELNALDIHENNQQFAVVAAIAADDPYGLLPGEAVPEIWYRWKGDADDGEYQRCDKPASLAHVHFGL